MENGVEFEMAMGAVNLEDDMMKDVSSIEKRYRRRSSIFFEMRKGLEAIEEISPEQVKVSEYIGDLKKEKQEWLDLSKQRKREFEDMTKKYHEHRKKRQVLTEEEILEYLEENDREYLQGLPDFESIENKYKQVRKSQVVLEELRRRNVRVAKQVLDSLRRDVEDEKWKIINHLHSQPL